MATLPSRGYACQQVELEKTAAMNTSIRDPDNGSLLKTTITAPTLREHPRQHVDLEIKQGSRRCIVLAIESLGPWI